MGSSSITSFGSPSSERAIATCWRWPPESVPTSARTLGDRHRQVLEQLAGLLLHVDLVELTDESGRPARTSPRARGRGSRPRRGCRTARGPGRRSRSRGARRRSGREIVTCWPSKRDRPRVGRVDAGDRLDERGLAGAVVADQRDDLAGLDLEVHVAERLDRPEALAHPLQGENGCAPVGVQLQLLSRRRPRAPDRRPHSPPLHLLDASRLAGGRVLPVQISVQPSRTRP